MLMPPVPRTGDSWPSAVKTGCDRSEPEQLAGKEAQGSFSTMGTRGPMSVHCALASMAIADYIRDKMFS